VARSKAQAQGLAQAHGKPKFGEYSHPAMSAGRLVKDQDPGNKGLAKDIGTPSGHGSKAIHTSTPGSGDSHSSSTSKARARAASSGRTTFGSTPQPQTKAQMGLTQSQSQARPGSAQARARSQVRSSSVQPMQPGGGSGVSPGYKERKEQDQQSEQDQDDGDGGRDGDGSQAATLSSIFADQLRQQYALLASQHADLVQEMRDMRADRDVMLEEMQALYSRSGGGGSSSSSSSQSGAHSGSLMEDEHSGVVNQGLLSQVKAEGAARLEAERALASLRDKAQLLLE